jgi:hypothetical protein
MNLKLKILQNWTISQSKYFYSKEMKDLLKKYQFINNNEYKSEVSYYFGQKLKQSDIQKSKLHMKSEVKMCGYYIILFN